MSNLTAEFSRQKSLFQHIFKICDRNKRITFSLVNGKKKIEKWPPQPSFLAPFLYPYPFTLRLPSTFPTSASTYFRSYINYSFFFFFLSCLSGFFQLFCLAALYLIGWFLLSFFVLQAWRRSQIFTFTTCLCGGLGVPPNRRGITGGLFAFEDWHYDVV